MTKLVKNTLKWRKNLRSLNCDWFDIDENPELMQKFIQINRQARDVIIDEISDPFTAHIIAHYLNKETKSDAFYVYKDKYIVAKFIPEDFLDDTLGIADYVFTLGLNEKEYIYENKDDVKIQEIVKTYKPEYLSVITKQYSKTYELYENAFENAISTFSKDKARKLITNMLKNASPHFFKNQADYQKISKVRDIYL